MVRRFFQIGMERILQGTSKRETCALEVIDKEFRENTLVSKFESLPHPFLRTLAKNNAKWKNEIEQINCLAHMAFASGSSLGNSSELIKWQQASPESWLVCEMNGEICGYIHVEPLSAAKGDEIRYGASHEGEIEPEDILKRNNLTKDDYMHIGSIVSKPGLDYASRQEVATRLLAGIVERALELSSRGRSRVFRVIAVDYPDAEGKHHARRLFQRYGFEHQHNWITSENPPHDVYILDLRKTYSPALYKLLKAMLAHKAKYQLKRVKHHRMLLRTGSIALILTSIIFSIAFASTAGWLPAVLVATSVSIMDSLCSLLKHADEEVKKLEQFQDMS